MGDVIGFPFMSWNEQDLITGDGTILPAFTARKCAVCGTWINCRGEGTKSRSDADHYFKNHRPNKGEK